jgi:hypothetical protein
MGKEDQVEHIVCSWYSNGIFLDIGIIKGWIVSPQMMCWSSNPCYLWMWPYLEIVFADTIKLRWGHQVALSQYDWYTYKEKKSWMSTKMEGDQVKTEAEIDATISQGTSRATRSWKSSLCWVISRSPALEYLDVRFLVSRLWENPFW